jgi:hypothetical protein
MGSHRVFHGVLLVRSGARRDSIIEHVRKAVEDGFRGRDLLMDARALAETPERLSPEMIVERAAEIAALGFRRCAVIPANTPLQRALAAYFAHAARQAGVETRVFLSLAEAESWLEVAVHAPAVRRPASA